jgi:UDP-glucose 4-epimerase
VNNTRKATLGLQILQVNLVVGPFHPTTEETDEEAKVVKFILMSADLDLDLDPFRSHIFCMDGNQLNHLKDIDIHSYRTDTVIFTHGLQNPKSHPSTLNSPVCRFLLNHIIFIQIREEEPLTAMRVLVTGSAGHLGEALVRTLRVKDTVETVGTDILASEFTNKVGSIVDRDHVRSCMSGVDVVLHTATLHKPHIVTHSKLEFIETNVTGTLHLLEEAAAAGVKAFIYTSTTSVFGDAMNPATKHDPAVWVTEDLQPIPKNIYGVTKLAAENLCQLFARNHQLPCFILRTSRFFPEADDAEATQEAYADENFKANEFLNRRVDIEDVVSAHLLAMEKATEVKFGCYIISATTPFTEADLIEINGNAPAVLKSHVPDYEGIYDTLGWRMNPTVDRVYVNKKARDELGWCPKTDFSAVLARLELGWKVLSPLAHSIGKKGYHDEMFEGEPYPVND